MRTLAKLWAKSSHNTQSGSQISKRESNIDFEITALRYSKITWKNRYRQSQFQKMSNLLVCDDGKSLPLSLTRAARIYCVFYMPHSSSNAIAWANEKHRHVYTASSTDGSFSYAVCFKKNIAFFFSYLVRRTFELKKKGTEKISF